MYEKIFKIKSYYNMIYQFEYMTYIIIVPNNMCGENLSFKLTIHRIKYKIKYTDRLFDVCNCKLLRYHLYYRKK